MNPVPILRNERGVALPMALIVLVALTTLMLAFAEVASIGQEGLGRRG